MKDRKFYPQPLPRPKIALEYFQAHGAIADRTILVESIKITPKGEGEEFAGYYYRLWFDDQGTLVIEGEIPLKISPQASNMIKLEFL